MTEEARTTDPARVAADKIVRVFSVVCNMHVNDILPDIREACAAKDAEIARLQAIVRVNGLRWGHTHAQIDAILEGGVQP